MNHESCKWHKYCTNCNPNGKRAEGKTVNLNLDLRKALTRRKNGNYIIEVEASNENLDLEGQRVLQSALLKSKDYFLHNGVISKDHLYKDSAPDGSQIYKEEFIIGEPLSVTQKEDSIVVECELYKDNPYAQKFIEMLKSDSSRVKASVGGTVLAKEDAEDGENIKSVLWDDLALTVAPVNPTLSGAVLHKALNPCELVKALQAGYGTDEALFTGGRALQGKSSCEDAIYEFIGEMKKGALTSYQEAQNLLLDKDIDKCDIIYIIEGLNREFAGVFDEFSEAQWQEYVKSV